MLNLHKKKVSVLAIVILYRKRILESETIEFLNRQQLTGSIDLELSLIIVDNSEEKYVLETELRQMESVDRFKSVRLINQYSNQNLGIIYNELINDNSGLFDYLNILDDDSKLPPSYYLDFSHFQDSTNNLVYSPKILESKTKLYSPKNQPPFIDIFNVTKSKDFPTDFIGDVSGGNIFSVMSGLFLKSELFDNGFLFDNNLKLYGLDNQLFLYLKKHEISCYVLPIYIEHSPSYLEENESIEKLRFRFVQRAISRRKLARMFNINPVRVFLGGVVSACSMAIKHQHPGFISDLLFVSFKPIK